MQNVQPAENDSCEHITLVERSSSLPWRAYAIRPYTCSYDSWIARWLNNIHLRRHGGRMRYAPTVLQLTELI